MLLFSLCKCCLRISVVQYFVHHPLRSHVFLCMHIVLRIELSRCGDAQGAHLCTTSSLFSLALPLLVAMPRGRATSLRAPGWAKV